MRNRIGSGLVSHLMWQPGQTVLENTLASQKHVSGGSARTVLVPEFSIEDLLERGQQFYSEKKKGSNYIGTGAALKEAMDTIGDTGIIASMPYLIAGKVMAKKDSHFLWSNWFTANSEDNIIVDKEGILTGSKKPIYLCVHGGGLLTSERIFKAYDEGLTSQNAAKYSDEEALGLLRGELPNGQKLELYHVDDVQNGKIANPFGRYGVWMEFDQAKQFESKYYKQDGFKNNKIVHARIGTLEHLDNYFSKAKDNDGEVRCTHRFNKIDPTQAQGRLLFVNSTSGLVGVNNLDSLGRLFGVAPKVPGSPKK